MKSQLLNRLFVPLTAGFLLCLAANWIWKADGFFINLSTTFVGILLTVWYVDWVLRQQEKQRWHQVDERVADRVRVMINATVAGVRRALGFGLQDAYLHGCSSEDPRSLHEAIVKYAETVIAPELLDRLRSLDSKGWRDLHTHVTEAHRVALMLLQVFQSRLAPIQLSLMLDLQDGLRSSTLMYTTFPDLIGVPKERWPRYDAELEGVVRSSIESSAKHIAGVITIVKALSETL
jgi:hypothetical protein